MRLVGSIQRYLGGEDGLRAGAPRGFEFLAAPESGGPHAIGLAVTREGVPVRIWVWPGNTNDQSVVEELKADLVGWRLGGGAIYVVDSGFSGQENLRALRSAAGHYIAGNEAALRDGADRGGALPPARAARHAGRARAAAIRAHRPRLRE